MREIRITDSLNVFINGEGYISYDDDYIPKEIVTNINGLVKSKRLICNSLMRYTFEKIYFNNSSYFISLYRTSDGVFYF